MQLTFLSRKSDQTQNSRPLDLLRKISQKLSNFEAYSMTNYTNIRHACTYLNAFSMVISNKVMIFNYFEIFENDCEIFGLSSVVCVVVSEASFCKT